VHESARSSDAADFGRGPSRTDGWTACGPVFQWVGSCVRIAGSLYEPAKRSSVTLIRPQKIDTSKWHLITCQADHRQISPNLERYAYRTTAISILFPVGNGRASHSLRFVNISTSRVST